MWQPPPPFSRHFGFESADWARRVAAAEEPVGPAPPPPLHPGRLRQCARHSLRGQGQLKGTVCQT